MDKFQVILSVGKWIRTPNEKGASLRLLFLFLSLSYLFQLIQDSSRLAV
jgi:hypothetical protein